MNPFSLLFNEILFRPLFNLLFLLLIVLDGSMGWAIILLTLLIRGLLYKSSAATMQMQTSMGSSSNMQEKMQKIQDKYADDPQQQMKEMMNLMKKDGMGPLKGCKAMFFQLPIFLGLYGVISNFAAYDNTDGAKARLSFDLPYSEQIYSFLANISSPYLDISGGNVQTIFAGIDLLQTGSISLAVITTLLMALSMKVNAIVRPAQSSKPQILPTGQEMPDMQKMMQPMMYGMSIFMGVITYSLAAGVGLYMATTTLFSLGQSIRFYRGILKAKFRTSMINKDEGEIVEIK